MVDACAGFAVDAWAQRFAMAAKAVGGVALACEVPSPSSLAARSRKAGNPEKVEWSKKGASLQEGRGRAEGLIGTPPPTITRTQVAENAVIPSTHA
jgi:hypothetical protein